MAHQINVVWVTKTLFDQLYCALENIFSSLEYLFVGGEVLDYRLLLSLSSSPNRPTHIINDFGQTENTTFSTIYEIIHENIVHLQNIPIGKPLANRQVYILDAHLNPVPIGAIGELYVGGVGLARGYLNRPELTAEKFIANPFQTPKEKALNKNSRLYQTGDLGRYLPDGVIECIGRNDFQVKIRGFRIELEEIERELVAIKGIQRSCVLTKNQVTENGDNKYLVGYYVLEQEEGFDKALTSTVILAELAKVLPDYMLPSRLVEISALPLTPNGKLNRPALEALELLNEEQYVAPRNEREQQICLIYSELLGLAVEAVGITDDFFRLGGNSLLVTRVAHRLSKMLDINLTVAEIFRARTPDRKSVV
jgi:acyl-coenzyme A synthetase/AMP-(fatty) acid ligase